KVMLTNHNDKVLNGYLSPKGSILISANPGTDILDYIKLISKNYYLDLIEFNDTEILNNPDEFLKSFVSILEAIGKTEKRKEESSENERDPDKIEEKQILLINQEPIYKEKFNTTNLLEVLLNVYKSRAFNLNFIESKVILIWLNYEIKDVNKISNNLYDIFDLFIKIPLLTKIERETVLKDFLEINSKIVFDINDIVNYTENWEVKDIKQLIKVGIFKHFLNSELNETSNEITDVLINLIVSGEYIPNISSKIQLKNSNIEKNEAGNHNEKIIYTKESKVFDGVKDISGFIKEIQESRVSDFMLNQLYENAASKYYTELTIIIDKLNKKEPLEENDMKLIAQYPFILNDSPNKAQINLEKAKKRVDLIKQAFGK
ncbi:MAG: hypothetical protein ACFFEY_14515, partial [Candidatus Thorarchaeota archaeon]